MNSRYVDGTCSIILAPALIGPTHSALIFFHVNAFGVAYVFREIANLSGIHWYAGIFYYLLLSLRVRTNSVYVYSDAQPRSSVILGQ